MTVALRSQTSSTFTSPGTGIIGLPAGTANGDFQVMFFCVGAVSTPSTPTQPTGFALPTVTTGGAFPILLNSGFELNHYVWVKFAGASEPSTYTVTYSTAPTGTGAEIWLGSFTGVNATTPVEFYTNNQGTNTASSGAGASSTATGGTTANTGDGVIVFGSDFNDTSNALTIPGTTPTFTIELTDPTSANFLVGFGAMAAAGATGNKVFVNNSSNGDPWFAGMMGLNIASGGGGGVPPLIVPTISQAVNRSLTY